MYSTYWVMKSAGTKIGKTIMKSTSFTDLKQIIFFLLLFYFIFACEPFELLATHLDDDLSDILV